MVMRALRRALTRHRRVPLERIKDYRKTLVRYKGSEFRIMEERLQRKLEADKTLQSYLNTGEHDYLLDIIVTEDADLIVIYQAERGLRRQSVNMGDPVAFNQLHKGGQFRYEYIYGRLRSLNRQESVGMLLHYKPTLVLKAKYQYS